MLRTSAGALAAGAATGLAGCSAIPGFGGGVDQTTKTFYDWTFDAKDVLGNEHIQVKHQDHDAIREHWDALGDQYREELRIGYRHRFGDAFGLEFGDADWTLHLGDFTVTRVDHDAEERVDSLLEERTEMAVDREDLDGYTTVVDRKNEAGYALDGTHILSYQQSYSDEGAKTQIETIVGTQTGEVETLGDRDTTHAEAVKRADGDVVNLYPGSDPAGVTTAKLGSETTTERLLQLHESADDIDKELTEESLKNTYTEVSFSGREVTAKREVETAEFSGL